MYMTSNKPVLFDGHFLMNVCLLVWKRKCDALKDPSVFSAFYSQVNKQSGATRVSLFRFSLVAGCMLCHIDQVFSSCLF